MTTTSVSLHHAVCCNCPRFTVWLYCLVWRCLPVLIPHCTHLLFFNPVCGQEVQKLKMHSYRWAASPLFMSPCVPLPPPPPTPLHNCSQSYRTCSPSSSSSHIPLFAIPSNHTLTHVQENQCFNPSLFLLHLHRMEIFVHTLPTPVISCFQEKTELKDWPA